jgi:hypothetical protein
MAEDLTMERRLKIYISAHRPVREEGDPRAPAASQPVRHLYNKQRTDEAVREAIAH